MENQTKNLEKANRVVPLSQIEEIVINGIPNIQITPGDIETLMFFGEDELLNHISINNAGGLLVIEAAQDFPHDDNQDFLAVITVSGLTNLQLKSVGNVELDGGCFKPDAKKIDANAVGTLNMVLDYGHPQLLLHGIGTVNIEGHINQKAHSIAAIGHYNVPVNIDEN